MRPRWMIHAVRRTLRSVCRVLRVPRYLRMADVSGAGGRILYTASPPAVVAIRAEERANRAATPPSTTTWAWILPLSLLSRGAAQTSGTGRPRRI